MKEIRRVVKQAVRRVGLDRLSRLLAQALLGLAAFACLAVLGHKLFFIGDPVLYAVVGATGLAALFVIVFGVRAWPSRLFAAVEVDDRLRLAERLSSALDVAWSEDPMAQAVVEDARAYARRVPVAEAFPFHLHREYLVALLLAGLALGLLTLFPQWDVLGRQAEQQEVEQEREAVRKEARKIRRELVTLKRQIAREGPKQAEFHLEKMDAVVTEMEKGELTRPQAMAKLTELVEELKQSQAGLARPTLVPQGVAQKAGLDMTKKLADALGQKDFAAAAAELEELMKKAEEGKLSEQEMKKLQGELKTLSASLQGSKSLCDGLGKLCDTLSAEDLAGLAEALKACELSLDELADLEAELDILSQCAGLCQGGQCGLGNRLATWDGTGVYSPGYRRGQGKGMGGPGIGAGGKAPVAPHDVSFDASKLKGKVRPGRVVGGYFDDNFQIKGEAKVEYVEAVEGARAEAAQALERQQVPRAYKNYVRDYFDEMKTE